MKREHTGVYATASPCSLRADILRIIGSYKPEDATALRMHCRRLSPLTNTFSKKLENFKAAIGLHYAHYNFVKTHTTIRCTPAVEAGVETSAWTVAELVEKVGE